MENICLCCKIARANNSKQLLRIERCHIKTLAVVALTNDIPEKHLCPGQVGTVVEMLTPGVVEVELSDLDRNPYAMCAIPESSLMVLHHHAIAALDLKKIKCRKAKQALGITR